MLSIRGAGKAVSVGVTMADSVELYDNVYGDFGSDAEAAVRRATYGANFAGLQRLLACTHRLAAERRLSCYAYLAEKA